MAAGKLSPRQKMIGMMYLVLTALLALNVSKEILDAFVTVNNGLENTGKSFDKDITALYAKFDEKKSIDPLRMIDSWTKAQQAKKMSQEMNQFIDALKKRLLRESEGFKNKEEDTLQLEYLEGKENYDVTTNILCGNAEDGSNGSAHELRMKLDQYKKSMLALLSEENQKSLHLNIETPDPKDGGEYRTWEMKSFYHTPIAADITILSKIQDDVKAAESDVVDALLRETDSDIIPFDTVAARVIAQTNYVMQGEQYQADIFLAAFNKTLSPQILIGQYDTVSGKMIGAFDSVHVANGLGKYSVDASREGIFTYEGVINMTTPKGVVRHYPFKSEYIVARPALTVSADKMNVMYAGLDNPISVSVPGVPNEKTHVTCDNGQLISLGNGKYMVKNPKVGQSNIIVNATTETGENKSMGKMVFRVKPLPKPHSEISGVAGSRSPKNSFCSSPGLICKYENFEFEAHPKVTSYHVEIWRGGIAIYDKQKQGNMFDQETKNNFCNMRRGDMVMFRDIVGMGPDEVAVKLDAIAVNIQ